MKAYRIYEENDGTVYGKFQCYVNEEKDYYEDEIINFSNRENLEYGMLYCPGVDMIVDETELRKIGKKINELTDKEDGSGMKSLNDMSNEEISLYFSLQRKYRNFYKKNVQFVEKGKEKEYLSNLNKVLKGDD